MKYDVKLQNYTFPMKIIFLWEEKKEKCFNNTNLKIYNNV